MSGLRAPTWGRWVAAAAVLVVGVAAGGTWLAFEHGGAAPASRPTTNPAPRVPAPRPPILAAASSAPMPTTVALAHVLASVLRDPNLGGHLAGVVEDLHTGTRLWTSDATASLPPASTAKLLTATAALEVLGPDATLSTSVRRDGTTLYLVGGGDVTLTANPPRRPAFPVAATVGELARRTAVALHGERVSRLCADTSAWTGPAAAPGWKPGYFSSGDIAALSPLELDEGDVPGRHSPHVNIPRVADPTGQAVGAFAAALRREGVTVAAGTCRAAAPAKAVPVAAVASPPVADLVQRMLLVSDNDLAESLGRAVARRAKAPASYAGEAGAVTAAVARLRVDVAGLHLVDASGLSRLDRVSPALLTQLLRLVLDDAHPELKPVQQGLPVAGFSGTLADRYRARRSAAAAGTARAKTGTLLGVNALAGYLVDADGRPLVYAFIADRAVGVDATEAALDRVVARLAGCGCS